MAQQNKREEIVRALQADILRLEGFKSIKNTTLDAGLGPMMEALPNASFPLGAVHEFLTKTSEDTASSSGFIAGLFSSFIHHAGAVLWVSASRKLFPPGLKHFGLDPDRFIFVDVKNQKEVLWVMEEALKCSALAAVVGEVNQIDFTSSRRLQLAVEHSQVTGFVLRKSFKQPSPTACVSRWRISSLPSAQIDHLPGIGHIHWKVELLKIKNGKPGVWNVQWRHDGMQVQHSSAQAMPASDILEDNFKYRQKAG